MTLILRTLAWLYAAVLFALNFVRIFDNNFWGDEAFTTNLVAYSVPEILIKTAADVHPPLYYLIVKLCYTLFGKQGWAFHLASVAALALLVVFAMTAVWKRFGAETALILVTLACLTDNAINYNVEVRMYSWGALLVLVSFYLFCRILDEPSRRHYILFTLASLAAAYTHYYCLVSVAFFYVVLLIYTFLRRREKLKSVLIVYAVTVAVYLPWLLYVYQSILAKVDSYWILDIPSFKESVIYLFSGQISPWLWVLLLIGLVISLAYAWGALKMECREEGAGCEISLHGRGEWQHADYAVMVLAGLCSILGTIAFGIAISVLVRPFYLERYIYPVSAVAWLLLGMTVSRLKGRRLYTLLLTVYLLFTCLPIYKAYYTSEKQLNERMQETLVEMQEITPEDVILTNSTFISGDSGYDEPLNTSGYNGVGAVAQYYFPGVDTELVTLSEDTHIPKLDPDTTYWLIATWDQTLDEAFVQLKDQGFGWQQVSSWGNLGTYSVNIFKLTYQNEEE